MGPTSLPLPSMVYAVVVRLGIASAGKDHTETGTTATASNLIPRARGREYWGTLQSTLKTSSASMSFVGVTTP
jgi:hypothetical protein